MSADDIADLLIRIGRLAFANPGEPELTPTQWAALRYFARANRYSRTVSAFAEFQATTRGTVSQTLKILTRRGYLSRTRSESDGRSVRLDLTERGRDAARRDPIARLAELVAAWPRAIDDDVARALETLEASMAGAAGCARFGRCELCRFLSFEADETGDHCVPRCRTLDTELDPAEIGTLCASYAPIRAY